MHLFMFHEVRFFHDRLCPALTASARARSFEPLRELAAELAPTVESFVRRFHLSADERPLFDRLTTSRFDRHLWRHFAGEFLLYSALETPEIAIEPALLRRFIGEPLVTRLFGGSRPLVLGPIPYAAGYQDLSDIESIAAELAVIDSAGWSSNALVHVEPDDRDEELAWIRDRYVELRAMFDRAREANCVIVCEEL